MGDASNFDWDKWINSAKFMDVISQRPIDHFARIVPTSICPVDKNVLYINSIDEWLDLNDGNHVISSLEGIVSSYLSRNNLEKPFGLEALMLVQRECDFEALCVLANEIFGHIPDFFDGKYEGVLNDPKELFNEMLEKLKK